MCNIPRDALEKEETIGLIKQIQSNSAANYRFWMHGLLNEWSLSIKQVLMLKIKLLLTYYWESVL